MYKIHAALTGFPFAIVTALVIIEILKVFKFKNLLLVRLFCSSLFFLYVIFAFTSGYIADWFLPEFNEATLKTYDEHYFLARILLFVSAIPLVFSYLIYKDFKKNYYYFYLLFLFINLGLVLVTANHGGELVFEHGVGVTLPDQTPKP